MDQLTRDLLQRLAARYEQPDFIVGDPSWFMHQVHGSRNQEAMAFIAAAISYGSRAQFMPRLQSILDATAGEPDAWLRDRAFEALPPVPPCEPFLPDDKRCFYRMQTRADMHAFFAAYATLLHSHGSLHDFVAASLAAVSAPSGSPARTPASPAAIPALTALAAITRHFAAHGSRGIIPKDTTSACKRLCMFLRWMVRTDSPVDLGLWADIIPHTALIMPLDTHVMQQARRLGLITSQTTSMATALRLTAAVAEVFPDDPLRADFALFGFGVNDGKG